MLLQGVPKKLCSWPMKKKVIQFVSRISISVKPESQQIGLMSTLCVQTLRLNRFVVSEYFLFPNYTIWLGHPVGC